MGMSLISNPPYNMKWKHPALAGMMPEYCGYEVPPESNADFAFVLSGLSKISDKAVFLLPCGVLSTSNRTEEKIRSQLIEGNLIEAIITLPGRMFESTSIPTCLWVISRNKKTTHVEMIDMRSEYEEAERKQNGQFGGSSHTKRTYTKTVRVIPRALMEKAVEAIKHQRDEEGYCQSTTIEEIRKNDYILTPSRYVKAERQDTEHRSFHDIAADYNRIVQTKNAIKITVNKTAAKRLGIPMEAYQKTDTIDLSESFGVVGEKVEKENYIRFTASDGIKIECSTKQGIPILIMDFIKSWSQFERYLNVEANRLLAEFRDALLPELMEGNVDVEDING